MIRSTTPGGVRDAYLHASLLHLDATHRLYQDLARHEAISNQVMDAVASGRPLADELRRQGSADWRPALSDSIRSFERCRPLARLRLIAVGLDEGLTPGDIGRLWGITRQLVARYLKEIDELDQDPPGAS